jgi:hypothetical protein
MWAPKGLNIQPYGFSSFRAWGFFLELFPLIACHFPWQLLHIAGIWNILGSLLRFRIHLHSFTHNHLWGCLQWSWSCHSWPNFLGLPLKLSGRLPDPITLVFCMPKKLDSWRLCKVCCFFKQYLGPFTSKGLGMWTWENTYLGIPVQDPSAFLFSRESILNEFTVLHTGGCNGWHLANFRGPSMHLSCCKIFDFIIMLLISLTTTTLHSQLSTISFSGQTEHI